jgi:hypothetical protein
LTRIAFRLTPQCRRIAILVGAALTPRWHNLPELPGAKACFVLLLCADGGGIGDGAGGGADSGSGASGVGGAEPAPPPLLLCAGARPPVAVPLSALAALSTEGRLHIELRCRPPGVFLLAVFYFDADDVPRAGGGGGDARTRIARLEEAYAARVEVLSMPQKAQ